MKFFQISFVLDNNNRLVVSSSLNFKGPVLHIFLYDRISEFSSDKSLGIEDSIVGIFGYLVLGCISYESLSFSEGDIRWGGPISLIIGNDLNSIILPNTDT
jgi:hypothetical protein